MLVNYVLVPVQCFVLVHYGTAWINYDYVGRVNK